MCKRPLQVNVGSGILTESLATAKDEHNGKTRTYARTATGSTNLRTPQAADHLGYDHHERTPESKGNSRNGYSKKTIKTSQGETEIKVPRDRNGSFEPQIVPKYKRDISEIEDKIIAMYGRGMSQRDIAQTIDEIYGFKLSAEQVSNITDYVVEAVEEWQTRPLEAFYPFAFVDCMYVSMRTERGVRNAAVYTVLAYTVNGEYAHG